MGDPQRKAGRWATRDDNPIWRQHSMDVTMLLGKNLIPAYILVVRQFQGGPTVGMNIP